MLNKFKSASLAAALTCISMAVAGCGGKSDTPNGTGSVGVGVGGYNPGIVTPIGIGGGQVTFSGTNVYTSLGLGLQGQTLGFTQNGQGTLTLGAVAVTGAGSTLTGRCDLYPGTTITVIANPISASSANITGVLNLSAPFMQTNFPQGMPAPMGLAIDLWVAGNQIYGGTAWICTRQDTTGCHGAYVTFNPVSQ